MPTKPFFSELLMRDMFSLISDYNSTISCSLGIIIRLCKQQSDQPFKRDWMYNFIKINFCSSGHPHSAAALWGACPAGADTQCRLLIEGVGFGRRGVSIAVTPQDLETSR